MAFYKTIFMLNSLITPRMFPFSFRESTSFVRLNIEEESTDNSNLSILTVCQKCNALVNDIDQHTRSKDCKIQEDLSLKNVQDSIFLNFSDITNVNSTTTVLDDLGNIRMNQTGDKHIS